MSSAMRKPVDIGADHSKGNTGPSPVNAYLRTRVMTASPEELRLLLLEGAVKFGLQGREGLEKKNYEQSFAGVTQCREIVLELLTTIRPEFNPDLAERVRSLYTFLYTELTSVNHERNVAKLDGVIKILEYERDTWALLIQKLAEERGQQAEAAPAADAGVSTGGPTTRAPLSLSA